MKKIIIPILFFCSLLIALISCKHYSSINTIDKPIVVNTCDKDSVYFDLQILPIFAANCAQSGCHNATSHKDGYVLDNYGNIMSKGITPFQPSDGDIINSILDGEMPKGSPNLEPEQIALIQLWIQQGCQNNHCDGLCDTANVTYSGTIAPIIQTFCNGCHDASTHNGGVRLDSYSYLSTLALSDSLYNSITANGVNLMPKGGQALLNCQIDVIRIWINAGAPNN